VKPFFDKTLISLPLHLSLTRFHFSATSLIYSRLYRNQRDSGESRLSGIQYITKMDSSAATMGLDAEDPKIASDLDETEEEAEELDESSPPLLHPDPSRMLTCVRAPCLKRITASTSVGGSGSSSPLLGTSPLPVAMTYSYSGIKTLCSSPSKRQVHFDAAPPQAGLTHSGDNYDRRPIECTQGGSQLDLRLPPRTTCSLHEDEADDEACEEDDEDEESKDERLKGSARWARLKNGGSLLGGATSIKFGNSNDQKNDSEDTSVDPNVCSVPSRGIRAFGGLAGRSGLTNVTSQDQHDDTLTRSNEVDNEKEGIDSHDGAELEQDEEAFRKAVYAALSKDPNATPMPSPSVRPRWECFTSYVDSSSNEDCKVVKKEGESLDDVPLAPLDDDQASSLHSPTLADTSRVATWTLDQEVTNSNDAMPLMNQTPFSLTLPPPKDSPSLEDGSSTTHHSSSPLSSRCSSSDAWSSVCGAGVWSGSEHDAFDIAFSKSMPALVTPVAADQGNHSQFDSPMDTPTSIVLPSTNGCISIPTARPIEEDSCLTIPLAVELLPQETEHEQATSSSSSGGGPGWLSSCCTSPEVAAVDVNQVEGKTFTVKVARYDSHSISTALMQHLAPLDLQQGIQKDSVGLNASHSLQSVLLDGSHPQGIVSLPTSGECSPRILSGDEEEANRKSSSCLFRSSSKKSRRARRTTSGDGRSESPSTSDSSRAPMAPRSKSMSAANCPTKRVSMLKKSSAFIDDFDEGALGGF
jgi:hypothetical protein